LIFHQRSPFERGLGASVPRVCLFTEASSNTNTNTPRNSQLLDSHLSIALITQTKGIRLRAVLELE
jgi:hypothetical protein